jgi:hypothetical protein
MDHDGAPTTFIGVHPARLDMETFDLSNGNPSVIRSRNQKGSSGGKRESANHRDDYTPHS